MSDPEERRVRHALRTIKATSVLVHTEPGGVLLTLVMHASEAGRRTAAHRIVGLLAEHGLALDATDPVQALLSAGDGVRVRTAP